MRKALRGRVWMSGSRCASRLLAGALLCVGVALAAPRLSAQQEDASPAPASKAGGVRITFLPPPMAGKLNLGIYDKAGKLVRILRREADAEKDFVVGLNGLITQWDGKDNAGAPLPSGKYFARGYCVGELEIEGVAYHCNDWITDDDSPRILRIEAIGVRKSDLVLRAIVQDGRGGAPATLTANRDGKITGELRAEDPQPFWSGERATVSDGKVVAAENDAQRTFDFDGLVKPLAACRSDAGVWVIDQTPEGTEIKEYAPSGELLRRLAIAPEEPQPVRIFASPDDAELYLIEGSPSLQRVRGLQFLSKETSAEGAAGENPAVSKWKVLFSKTIAASDSFAQAADKLGRPQPFKPEAKAAVRLLPNPLYKDSATTVDLQIAVDEAGSYLRTADGLPLWRVAETPRLKWAVLGRDSGSKAITIFQSDGAAVEEFRARKLANMMAFDAGEYELEPPRKP